MSRDEFSKKTIQTIALRAGYICSNPDCRRPTSGPHSDPSKALITGEAAHICAASEKGPRFDLNQTAEQRKAISNAIWLCGNCNKKIDTDWIAWPAEKLQEIKTAHECWVAAEAMIPAIPKITLSTLPALRFSHNLCQITTELQVALREQELVIENPNRVDLKNLRLEMNLPEVVMAGGTSDIPIGSQVRTRAIQPANRVFLSGDACATVGRPIATTHHLLEADNLGAGAKFVTAFYTTKPEMTMPYDLVLLNPDSDFADPAKMDEHKECHFHILGTYQFLLRGEYVTGSVFVPLLFSAESRTIVSYPVQDTTEPWKVWHGVVMRGATLQTGPGGTAAVTS